MEFVSNNEKFIFDVLSSFLVEHNSTQINKIINTKTQHGYSLWKKYDINSIHGWKKLIIEYIARITIENKQDNTQELTLEDISYIFGAPLSELITLKKSKGWKKNIVDILQNQDLEIMTLRVNALKKAYNYEGIFYLGENPVDFIENKLLN